MTRARRGKEHEYCIRNSASEIRIFSDGSYSYSDIKCIPNSTGHASYCTVQVWRNESIILRGNARTGSEPLRLQMNSGTREFTATEKGAVWEVRHRIICFKADSCVEMCALSASYDAQELECLRDAVAEHQQSA